MVVVGFDACKADTRSKDFERQTRAPTISSVDETGARKDRCRVAGGKAVIPAVWALLGN